jgi:hypothetical protein
MFLSDEIVEIEKGDSKNKSRDIIIICYERAMKMYGPTNESVINALKSVCNSFNEAVRLLNKEGIYTLRPNGLRDYFMQDIEFAKKIHDLGFKL